MLLTKMKVEWEETHWGVKAPTKHHGTVVGFVHGLHSTEAVIQFQTILISMPIYRLTVIPEAVDYDTD